MNTVQSGSTVILHYTGTLDSGAIFDSSRVEGREPFTFQAGAQQVIPGFDAGVLGMTIGEKKTITIGVEEAYGEKREDLVFVAPMERLPEGVEVGTQLQVSTPEGPMMASIIGIDTEKNEAQIDHNHPLAGENLTFELELLDIQ